MFSVIKEIRQMSVKHEKGKEFNLERKFFDWNIPKI